MKKVGFFGIFRKVKVMTLTWLDFLNCGTSQVEGERKACEELKRMVIEEEMAFFNSKLPPELRGPTAAHHFFNSIKMEPLSLCDAIATRSQMKNYNFHIWK